MQNWKYISIIVLLLLGAASFFGYWGVNQYKLALDAYDASYSQLSASIATHTKIILDRTTATNTDISGTATTSPDISLIFPPTGDDVYSGCSYKITWETSTTTASSTPIKSLDVALIDAETQEAMGQIASGLLKRYELEPDSQSLDWKVGVVLPGEYFILVSQIDSLEEDVKSKHFAVQQMPKSINADEQKNICKESGGLFPTSTLTPDA